MSNLDSLNSLNERIVVRLLEWQKARSGLARSPEAFVLADQLIELVREHDRSLSSRLPADLPAIKRMLEAFTSYLNVVDALVRALRETGMNMGDVGLDDHQAIRRELTALIGTLDAACATASPPVSSPGSSAPAAAKPASRKRNRQRTAAVT